MNTNILGKHLRKSRVALNLLIRQVASELEIDPSLMSRIERGEKMPTRAQVEKLVGILHINGHHLMCLYLYQRLVKILHGETAALDAVILAAKELNSVVSPIQFTAQPKLIDIPWRIKP